MTPTDFSPDERTALARALERGDATPCPACGTAMDVRPVPPRSDVSYVRRRAWLVCPACHRSTVIDRSERR